MIRRTALVLAVFAVAGCDSAGPLDLQPAPLIPLDVGAEWVFDSERTLGAPRAASVDTLRVVAETTREGVRWAEMRGSSQRLDVCLGGYYALIDGDVWYTHDFDEAEPYRLFAREDAYTVANAKYDADVTLDRSGDLFAYAFDFRRVRNTFIPDGLPVLEGAPAAIRTLREGTGFDRYDQPLVGSSGSDSLRIAVVDRFTRRAFVPAE